MTEPTPPPAEPAPTTVATSGGGSPLALIALVGALIVIGATFAPWLGQGGDGPFSDSRVELSGWDFYDDRAEGANSFYVEESFRAEDTPFFNGLSTVIAGAAVGIVAIGLLALRGRNRGLDALLAFLGVAAAALTLVVCFTNLVSYLRAGDGNEAGLKWGLLLLWIGAFLGAAVLPASLAGGKTDTPSE